MHANLLVRFCTKSFFDKIFFWFHFNASFISLCELFSLPDKKRAKEKTLSNNKWHLTKGPAFTNIQAMKSIHLFYSRILLFRKEARIWKEVMYWKTLIEIILLEEWEENKKQRKMCTSLDWKLWYSCKSVLWSIWM